MRTLSLTGSRYDRTRACKKEYDACLIRPQFGSLRTVAFVDHMGAPNSTGFIASLHPFPSSRPSHLLFSSFPSERLQSHPACSHSHLRPDSSTIAPVTGQLSIDPPNASRTFPRRPHRRQSATHHHTQSATHSHPISYHGLLSVCRRCLC